jgi:hypothetical protein
MVAGTPTELERVPGAGSATHSHDPFDAARRHQALRTVTTAVEHHPDVRGEIREGSGLRA